MHVAKSMKKNIGAGNTNLNKKHMAGLRNA